jgi:regulation of enolase protein 1 (concanavalin A-like superfamily)
MATAGTIAAQPPSKGPLGVFSTSTDIGKTLPGSTVYDPHAGSYVVTGGGADMWGAADDFHFTSVQLSGDVTLTADVQFHPNVTVPLEKAVLVIRQSLDPGSAYADVAIHGDGHICLQYRATQGGKTEDVTAKEHGSVRLRIVRHGNVFTASSGSADGKMIEFSSITIPMEGPVYVGIGFCSHNADGVKSATFSNVKIEKHAK